MDAESEIEVEELRRIIKDAKEKLDRKEEENTRKLSKMIQSLTQEFTCSICQELFVKAATLPCAHSFCRLCLRGWLRRNHSRRKSCPICRQRVDTNGFHSVVIDNAIDKMVETIGGEQKQRRIELKAQRIQEEASMGMSEVHAVIQGQFDDASEYRDGSRLNNPANHPGNSRRRQRDSRIRARLAPSRSARFRYRFFQPPLLTTGNDADPIQSISSQDPQNSEFPPDHTPDVPVIDLTTLQIPHILPQNHPTDDTATISSNNDDDIVTVSIDNVERESQVEN